MISELKKARLRKLENIKKAGIDPYPAKCRRTHTIKKAISDFRKLSYAKEKINLVGRVMAIRFHGGLSFFDIQDQSGIIQLIFKKEKLGADAYNILKNFDVGDFIEANGVLFFTKNNEKTLDVEKYNILAKSILPLPEKWRGLRNEETRYRKRYLDLIMNEKTKNLFVKKSNFIKNIRKYLDDKGFMEVETPILEKVPGGADAEPFITHHNKLSIDLYLRISLELHLKRLIVGGFEKIYEIGKVFRNEGISVQHLQEFTMLEFYWTYVDYEDLMKFIEDFYATVISNTFGSLNVKYKGNILNFNAPWKRVDYREIIIEKCGIDIDKYPAKKNMQKALKEIGIDPKDGAGRGKLIDQLYKKLVRPKLVQPMFLVNHPIDISPLAKRKTDDKTKVQRFQILAAGAEIGNAFSELNDPIDQRKRFEIQKELREKGDKEAQMMDNDFIEALEYGMPPTAGIGIGIDRLFMILTNQESIRDVVFFPIMKPKEILHDK